MFKSLARSTRKNRRKREIRRNARRTTPRLERLEDRQLMAADIALSNGSLHIDADDSGGSLYIREYSSNNRLTVSGYSNGGNVFRQFSASDVDRIFFNGSDLRDRVYNYTSKHSTMYGRGGDDSLVGGSVHDYLYGQAGNDYLSGRAGADFLYGDGGDDRMYGGSGNDYMSGGSGDDRLSGSSGNDSLYGWTGTDELIGGSGNDTLSGSYGNDDLRGGSGNDYLDGGSGNDVLRGEDHDDRLYGQSGQDMLYSGRGRDLLDGGSGNDTLVSIDGDTNDTLYGSTGTDSFWVDDNGLSFFAIRDDIKDESTFERDHNVHFVGSYANGADRTLNGDNIADPTDGTSYRDFSNNPLFARSGPSELDVDQGGLGDCWLVAALGAAARANPNAIQQTIVDLGDGTYAVELGGGFYRVDGDLPTSGGNLVNAGLGREDSLWVALVEKAYAFYRTGANTYASLAGGDVTPVLQAIGASDHVQRTIRSGIDALRYMKGELGKGKAVTVTIQNAVAGSGLISSHVYVVERVNYSWVPLDFGRREYMPVSVTLRNPWGTDGGGTLDGVNDGWVTVSGDQIAQSMWGNNQGIDSAYVA